MSDLEGEEGVQTNRREKERWIDRQGERLKGMTGREMGEKRKDRKTRDR